MSRKYFGTDGIRGKVGVSPITPDFVMRLGYAAGKVLAKLDTASHARPTVLIGKDTRVSGYMLEAALEAGFAAAGVDIMFGIGGTPEGVVAAAALKAMGGEIIGRLHARDDAERKAAEDAGYDLNKVLTTDDLISGEDIFFAATGVTDGELLRGVRYDAYGARSHSLVMRSRSGTIRYIDTHHRHDRLAAYSSSDTK